MHSALVFALLAGAAVALPSKLEARSGTTPPVCKEIAKPPKTDICQRKGALTTPAVLSHPNVYGADTCANVCGGTTGCASWSYNTNAPSQPCTLYSKTLRAQGFHFSTTSTTTYADRACSTCKACIQNTFANGGFESGTIAPWTCTGDAGYTCTVGAPGSGSAHAAELTPAAAPGAQGPYGDLQFIQSFQLCLGQTYTIAFDYATAAPAQDNALSVTFNGQQVLQKQNFDASNVDTYTHFSANVTQSLDNSASWNIEWLNFNSSGSAPLLIDNVSVTLIA